MEPLDSAAAPCGIDLCKTTPLPVTPAAVQSPAAAPTGESTAVKLKEENELLKKELAEAQEALDKTRKEKVEIAVSNSKLKAQVAQMSRTIEKTQS